MKSLAGISQPEWIGAKEFEAFYCLPSRFFWQLIKDGKVAAYRPNRRRTLIRRSDIERYLESTKSAIGLQNSSAGQAGEAD
jgi:excisionase family DNA binding protein